jgi:hypothetical protein
VCHMVHVRVLQRAHVVMRAKHAIFCVFVISFFSSVSSASEELPQQM